MLLVNLLLTHLRMPNDISISDAETQSGNEHEPSENVNDDAQPSSETHAFSSQTIQEKV